MRYYIGFNGGNKVENLTELDVRIFADYAEASRWVAAKNKALAAKGVKADAHYYYGVGTMKALRERLSRDKYEWRVCECLRKLGEAVFDV